MALRYTPFCSPNALPLDGYREMPPSTAEAPANDDDDDGPAELTCDFCNDFACLDTPEGYPICVACAEEREDCRFNFSSRE